ncbi:pirin family protein [Pseudonocardiaceae bacterium YIM PH 21723]|nr:pirin family protein [Pseudonocardiaceae bacterium YIM PH 21723]
MPAVTADTLTLPRLPELPQDGIEWRRVRGVVNSIKTFEGEGFPVRRPFPGPSMSMADPFLMLDHLGAVEYAPGEAKGAPWHPHRGFETVTYVMDGALEHADSTGGGGVITDGGTQWMTAGAGVLHSELPTQELVAKGGEFHSIQLWVNLPKAQKWVPPRYQDIAPNDVSLLSSADGGALVRVIAGSLSAGGSVYAGPGQTYTPITLLHATIAPGAQLELPWPEEFNAMVYALNGSGTVGREAVGVDEGQLAVFGHGSALTLRARDAWDVLILGGLPINEPVARYGPFVMNTREEIVQAFEDYQAGRLATLQPKHVPHTSAADEQL